MKKLITIMIIIGMMSSCASSKTPAERYAKDNKHLMFKGYGK